MPKSKFKSMSLLHAALGCSILVGISGCSSTSSLKCYLDTEGYYQNCGESSEVNEDTNTYSSFQDNSTFSDVTQQGPQSMHFKLLDEYAEQIAAQLVEGIDSHVQKGIAVASFVYLDSELQTSSALGNQLSETLIHELQKFGLPIVDTKVSKLIKVSNSGDFIYSKNPNELSSVLDYEYILSGTMLKESNGTFVQSRIINVRNKQVLTTASKFIPSLVIGA